MVGIALSIVVYSMVLWNMYGDEDMAQKDLLNKQIIKMPLLGKNCCSWWPISHFVCYMLLAYKWPQYWKEIFAMGVAWEGIEWVIRQIETRGSTRMMDDTIEYQQWWSSSSKDILFNAAGISVGLILHNSSPL